MNGISEEMFDPAGTLQCMQTSVSEPINRMVVDGETLIRRMRGRTQPCLVRARDGELYVVKLNSQANHRLLVNEWVAAQIFGLVGLPIPQCALMRLDPDLVAKYCATTVDPCTTDGPVAAGFHFASRCPGRGLISIFDFMPDRLLPRVARLDSFVGTLVVDVWLGLIDARQAIFALADSSDGRVWSVNMIGNTQQFAGRHWDLWELDECSIYFRPAVYDVVVGPSTFDSWLDLVHSIPTRVIMDLRHSVPHDWLHNDDSYQLRELLAKVAKTRKTLRRRITRLARLKLPNPPFRNWGAASITEAAIEPIAAL